MTQPLQIIRVTLCMTVAIAGLTVPEIHAQSGPRVGLLPFDVESVQGGRGSGAAMSKLVRAEMLSRKTIVPELLSASEDDTAITPAQAADAGRTAGVDVVVLGTVLDAASSQSSHSARSARIPGVSVGIGGNLRRSTATVTLLVELIDLRKASATESFAIEAKETDTGIGVSFQSALGGFDTGRTGWDKTPMGKAIKKAASKVTEEVLARVARR